MRVRVGEGVGVGQGAESAVISKNFLQRRFFSPSNFPKTSLGIKIFLSTALAQMGTFCTSGPYPFGFFLVSSSSNYGQNINTKAFNHLGSFPR